MNDSLAYQLQSAQNDPEVQKLLEAAISHNRLSKIEDILKRKNDTDVQKIPAKHNHQSEKSESPVESPEDGSKPTPKKAGRKPLTTMPADKRKAQNRAAQRAFRERKDKYVKELEDKVKELEDSNEKNQEENEKLRKLLEEVKNENHLLKENFTFQPPVNALDNIPTLTDLLKGSNLPVDSSIFSPNMFPWTPNSISGKTNFAGGSESPENQGLSPSDDTSSPHALSSYAATPEIANIGMASSQSVLSTSSMSHANFFAPIGEVVGDPLITAESLEASEVFVTNESSSGLDFPVGLSDYRDVTNILFDESLTGDLAALPSFFEDSWKDEYEGESLFSPLQNVPHGAGEGDQFANIPDGQSTEEDKQSDAHISLEDCKVLEYGSLPFDFDINDLCEELRKKATCSGRMPCPEKKSEQVAQL
ncbi:hypothetical protein K493DRAFT_334690 [Basidiobolus meristosporus CBS 931.73]|uniref:BZIP domain-containing protein n=1 Tax=Basidiobolus meristosporus CBS 931.73 TaxID=1314790 RepID=A0A1Y1YVY7_9FUNG|nr:hypothetical protein K493DRAFT_334690 [Basidiobolus meristosporus CBS 931.73]|eukprot:ORY02218.1 hypothetical protein K493DRAFT_334690 [Basidiobolus meristosporus CBS 931.73]